MKYFIFRNYTVEPLFVNFDAGYSQYGDISVLDQEADIYLWFYQISPNPDPVSRGNEIDDFLRKIHYLIKQIPPTKDLYVFSLVDMFPFKWQNSDFSIEIKMFEFNNKIFELTKLYPNVRLIDLGDFVRDYPIDSIINWKYYFTSFTFLNPSLAKQFTIWFSKKSDAIQLKRKKCIILDLDNTLWGGVLGEDGIEGIKLGNSYPGNCFTEFQRYLVEASNNGIMLAICSKNNEADALVAIENNPYMILKMDHIVAHRINWENKPTNIKSLAQEMNIGLDSMVFFDDSPVERELVKQAIPMIEVPEFPTEPYNITPFFKDVLNCSFQIYKLTIEDKKKTSQYKENWKRSNFRSEYTSIDDYIKNLEIEIEIRSVDGFSISRASQMTQKTNQFNLTTKRYSESDINRFIKDGNTVLCASVKDKFGDNGISILTIITYDSSDKSAHIDLFLLSCRILGRGIENVFLNFVLNQIFLKGFKRVYASYVATGKNELAKEFYKNNCFIEVESKDAEVKYLKELNEEILIQSNFKINYA